MKLSRKHATHRRHRRIRRRVVGSTERPRLAVFRSHEHIYAQLIDDTNHHTIVSSSTLDPDLRQSLDSTSTQAAAAIVGKQVAERAIAAGVSEAVFDRGGKLYHGRVKALAEAARAAGLKF